MPERGARADRIIVFLQRFDILLCKLESGSRADAKRRESGWMLNWGASDYRITHMGVFVGVAFGERGVEHPEWRVVASGGEWWRVVASGGEWWRAVESGGEWWRVVESGGEWWRAVASGGA